MPFVRKPVNNDAQLITLRLRFPPDDDAHAKDFIPSLENLGASFEKRERDFQKSLGLVISNSVQETVDAIETSPQKPELVRLR